MPFTILIILVSLIYLLFQIVVILKVTFFSTAIIAGISSCINDYSKT